MARVGNVAAAREREALARRARLVRRRCLERGYWVGGHAPYGLVRALVETGTGAVLRVLARGESVKLPGAGISLRQGPVEQVASVRLLFDGIEAGQSLSSLADELNLRKVPPPSLARRGAADTSEPGRPERKWNRSTVSGILRNELYIGVLVFGRLQPGDARGDGDTRDSGLGPVRIEGFYPDPPISREQFARVQERLAARAPHARKRMLREEGG